MMRSVRRIGAVAAVAMTLTVVAGTSSASPPTTTAAASNTTTWWVDSTWISPLAGWVLGEGKAGCSTCVIIKYTDDGGRTWTMVPTPAGRTLLSGGSTYTCQNSGGCVTHLVFVNRDDGYLFGPDLFTTTDGGRAWHRQAGEATVALQIVAPGVVWRLTYDSTGCPGPCRITLLQQAVGSSTAWSTVRAPFNGTGTFFAPQIVSTDTARVLVAFYGHIAGGVTSHAFFYVTGNEGRSWSLRADPCGRTGRVEDDAYDTSATGPGVVVVGCVAKSDSNTGFVLVSRDGGRTFGPRRPVPPTDLSMIDAVSASTIVLATGNISGGGPLTYTLETSTNGGVTWRTVVRDPETLTSSTPGESYLGFVSPTVGHWIGYGNKLWTTTDGGEHWTASNV